MGILPKAPTNVRGLGNFGVFELDVDLEYSTPVPSGRIFTFTQQFNLRGWDGPKSSPFFPGVGLPGNVYRFGWDMAFFKPEQAGWSYEFGFTPSMNSDFNNGLSSNAWNFDGRWVFYYKSSDTIKYALGAGYWDRVNDRVIPYAGVIWTPSNRWDLRFLFPESRISFRLRDRGRFAESLYARGEFHAEAYEVDLEVAGGRDKIELTDWRILIGLQFDDIVGSPLAAFVEAGWVFDRQIQFLSERPGFNVSTGFIARAGVQY